MGSADLSSLLEKCIQELQAGSNLEEILARYPKYARQLKPLLETAAWSRKVRDGIQIPDDARSLSRKAFTSPNPDRQTGSTFHRFNFRLAFSLIAIVLLLVSGSLGTTIVSAQALPGDTLYPVKLAWEQIQISLTSGTVERLHLEQTFDQQRVDEVTKLINLGRSSNVTFTGVLASSNNAWNVAGIGLNVDDQQAGKLPNLQNTVVQVSGETVGKSVKVKDIEPHLVTLNGQIQQINSENMQVDGVNVTLDKNTDIDGELSVNQQVHITAREQEDGELIAIMVNGKPAAAATSTKQSSSSQTPGDQKSGSAEKTPQPTDQETNPTPTGVIQPMMTSPTIGGTSMPGDEQEKGSGSNLKPPTATPTKSDSSNHAGEYQPTPSPTLTPSYQSERPAATRSPTQD